MGTRGWDGIAVEETVVSFLLYIKCCLGGLGGRGGWFGYSLDMGLQVFSKGPPVLVAFLTSKVYWVPYSYFDSHGTCWKKIINKYNKMQTLTEPGCSKLWINVTTGLDNQWLVVGIP